MYAACRTLVLSLVLLSICPGLGTFAQGREQIIGTWILNLEKSQYAAGQAPKSEVRSFDDRTDGMILCTFHRETARGDRHFGHWLVRLNGDFHPEYSRAEGGKPTASTLQLRKIDDRTYEANAKQQGKVYFKSTMTISPDGKALTWKISTTNAQGAESTQVRAYDRE
jgi:hypothetical protein